MRSESLYQKQNPTAPEEGAATAAGLGVTPADVEQRWTEFDEEEKTGYIIAIEDAMVDEEGYVMFSRIRIERKYYPIYPYGNYVSTVWVVEWKSADTIVVSTKIVRDSWNGTGSEFGGSVVVEGALPETPWFFNYEELADTIEKHGVKKTMRWVLDSIKAMAIDILGGGE
jgi:hypothetical protein